MAKASANLFPYVHLVPAAAPASPAAGSQRLYLDSGDSNKLKRKDSSGTVTTIEGGGGGVGDHGARVKKDATQQSISNGTVTALTWQTEDWDTDNFWVSGFSTRMTIPTGLAGRYIVGASVTFDTATAFDQLISIGVNGTELESTRLRINAGNALLRTTTILSLSVADYVEAFIYQGSGSSKSTPARANAAEFWVQKLT